MKVNLFYPIALAVLTAGPVCLNAETVSWSAGADGDFTTGTNWSTGSAPVNDTATDVAQLVGPTVNMDVSRSVGGLDLITAGSTLTGTGTSLTLSDTFGFTGSQDLGLGGTVTLDLNGTDTALNYTGNITIGTGSSIVSERNAFRLDTVSHANTTVTLDGGTLSASGDHIDVAGRNFVLTANGGTLQHAHARNMYGFGGSAGNFISGVGQLTISGGGSSSTAGRMQLDSTNTYTGGTRIENGGQAWVYSNASLGEATTGVTMTTGGTLYLVNNLTTTRAINLEGAGRINTNGKLLTYNGGVDAITGTGSLEVVGGGEMRFGGSTANTYSGGTTLDGTGVRMGAGDTLGTGDITLKNGGYLKNDNNSFGIANNITLGDGGGGIESGWSNRTIAMDGVISGDGALTIRNDSSQVAMRAANTYTGGTTVNGLVRAQNNSSFGTGDITLDAIVDGRGRIQNDDSNTVLANNLIISDTNFGGALMAGWNKSLTIDGVVSGAGTLTITNDSGAVVLSGTENTFSGDIVFNAAGSANLDVASLGGGSYGGSISGVDTGSTLDITGAISFEGDNTFAGSTIVRAGGAIGGDGSFAGDVTFEAGAGFIFSETSTLTVGGTLLLDSTFGVDDIFGLSSSTAAGTYTVVEATGDFSGIENFGEENAFDLGDGATAYFQNGSLQLVVEGTVPEPSTCGLIAGALALGSVMVRRRRS